MNLCNFTCQPYFAADKCYMENTLAGLLLLLLLGNLTTTFIHEPAYVSIQTFTNMCIYFNLLKGFPRHDTFPNALLYDNLNPVLILTITSSTKLFFIIWFLSHYGTDNVNVYP